MIRLGDSGVHTFGDTSAGQLLLTRRGKIRMDGVGIVFELYIAPPLTCCFKSNEVPMLSNAVDTSVNEGPYQSEHISHQREKHHNVTSELLVALLGSAEKNGKS